MITSILILESSSVKIREIRGSIILVLPNVGTRGETPTLPERGVTSSMETDFPELQALPRPSFGDREWVLRGSLPSGDLPQTSQNPSTPPPPPAESAMSINPQIIEKDGEECKACQ